MDIDYLLDALEYRQETGDLVWKQASWQRSQWNGMFAGKVAGYRVPKRGYLTITFRPNERNGLEKVTYIMVHRIIFAMHHGYWPETVDHIDGNTTNNRIENLRSVTRAQHSQNAKTPCTNKSGHKGVRARPGGRYTVRIRSGGKCHQLGGFSSFEDAVAAYKAAAARLHGEFARQE